MKFDELNVESDFVKAVTEMGYDEPTYIQEQSIPLLKAGKDLIAQSETGSGKTAAFALPILEKIVRGRGIQCLVLAPTRELAEQVAVEFKKFSKYRPVHVLAVYGGVAINPQIDGLQRAEVVVATPGRLLDHLQRGTIDVGQVRFLVLDEADKMFEMGFIEDVQQIISQLPQERQTMLFSATISTDVREIAQAHMHDPENVKANPLVDVGLLSQVYYDVPSRDKFSLLLHLIKAEDPKLAMVFCSTRINSDVVARNLHKNGVSVMAIHGGHSQNRRTSIMKDFHAGKLHILVATDVAARGLDIKNVTHIFNYDIPKTSKEYVHRIGRTARAGESGKAISLLSDRDHDNFRAVLADTTIVIDQLAMPSFPRVPFAIRSQGFARGQGGNYRRSEGRRGGQYERAYDSSRPASRGPRQGSEERPRFRPRHAY